MNDYFCILNDEKLYIEIVFVDFNTEPLFFLCKSDKHIYIIEGLDLDDYEYYIGQTTYKTIRKMLNQEITMREVMLISSKKYHLQDNKICEIAEFDSEWLPYEEKNLTYLTIDVQKFKNKLSSF